MQAWNAGLALASLDLAAQAGLVPLPEPRDRPPSPAPAKAPKG